MDGGKREAVQRRWRWADDEEIKMEWEGRRDGWYQGRDGNDSRDDYVHKLFRVERGERVRKGWTVVQEIENRLWRKSDRNLNIYCSKWVVVKKNVERKLNTSQKCQNDRTYNIKKVHIHVSTWGTIVALIELFLLLLILCVRVCFCKWEQAAKWNTDTRYRERARDNALTCVPCCDLVDPCKTQLITILYSTTRHRGEHTDQHASADVWKVKKRLQLPPVIISQYWTTFPLLCFLTVIDCDLCPVISKRWYQTKNDKIIIIFRLFIYELK